VLQESTDDDYDETVFGGGKASASAKEKIEISMASKQTRILPVCYLCRRGY